MNKLTGLWIFLSIVYLSVSLSLEGATILIDPGHGGDDHGAVRSMGDSIYKEKLITLDVALKLFLLLKKNHSVYLTRSVDRNVSLEKRSQMAEQLKADLVVAIHANTGPLSSTEGLEIYYLDNQNNRAVQKVEKTLNKKGKSEIVDHILVDIVVDKSVEKSHKLAKFLDTSLKRRFHSRGIKAATFYVLALNKRPSVLIELGYLSNEKEAKLLVSDQEQERYAGLIAQGIKHYIHDEQL